MASADNLSPDAGTLPGTGSSLVHWRAITEDQWRELRDVRLTALQESPRSFLSKYSNEVTYGEERWRAEFSRGEWIIVDEEGRPPDALIGITRSDDIPSTDRYLEFVWVSPRKRRSKLATNLIRVVLERLEASGCDTAWLWILDGNEKARELYSKCGFTTTGERHQPRANPSLWEERMTRRLRPRPQ
jgi:ribosomal protein S18 acetylase RimI-like enzyme